MAFKIADKAEPTGFFARVALMGPTGAGKTFSGLAIGAELARLAGGRLVVIDSERGSAARYWKNFDFAHGVLHDCSPDAYIEAIRSSVRAGFKVILIDSLSQAWSGRGGALEMVDRYAKNNKGDSFGAWRHVTPKHHELIDAILTANAHVIVTMRSKMDHVKDVDERTGKPVVRKVGMAAVQRDGIEYEFDIVGELETTHHEMLITKTRCHELDGKAFIRPGAEFAEAVYAWVTDGPERTPAPGPVFLAPELEAEAEAAILARIDEATEHPTVKAIWEEVLNLTLRGEVKGRLIKAINEKKAAITAAARAQTPNPGPVSTS